MRPIYLVMQLTALVAILASQPDKNNVNLFWSLHQIIKMLLLLQPFHLALHFADEPPVLFLETLFLLIVGIS